MMRPAAAICGICLALGAAAWNVQTASAAGADTVEMTGTVIARGEHALLVQVQASTTHVPASGDRVEFGIEITGIPVYAGLGEVIGVDRDHVEVRVLEGDPGLRMAASIQASGLADTSPVRPDPDPLDGPAPDSRLAHARMLAREAARSGANLSISLSRLEQLRETRETVSGLASISTRYQAHLDSVELAIDELQQAVTGQARSYRDKLAELGGQDSEHVRLALAALNTGAMRARERVVLDLIETHIAMIAGGNQAGHGELMAHFQQRFRNFED